jgi:hypothetical protein
VTKRNGRPQWAARVLAEIHRLVALGWVRFTLKATHELAALELGLDEQDALHILSDLRVADLVGRVESERAPEWLYVCKSQVAGIVIVRQADRAQWMRGYLVPRVRR